MSVKLRDGSTELEVAYIDWLRSQGRNPVDGIDSFFLESDFVRTQRLLIHDSEREQLTQEARLYLKRRSRDPLFIAQFPVVYSFQGQGDKTVRYTVTLTLADQGAEWTGRVWDETGYLGEIQGSGNGPHANYMELARMHIESQVGQAGALPQTGR